MIGWELHSLLQNDLGENLDTAVAAGFGREWSTFDQSEAELSMADREAIFASYFNIFPWNELPPDPIGLDVGCGSGRWAVRENSRYHDAVLGFLQCDA